MVRLYDALVAYAVDLGDLAADLGGAAGETLIDQAAAQVPLTRPANDSIDDSPRRAGYRS